MTQCGEAWSPWTRYLWSAGEAPSLGISCACGCLSTSRICHIAHSLRKLGENNWGDEADSRKLEGNQAGGPAGVRYLAQVLTQERDPLWARAHLCDSVPPSFLHNSHISLNVGQCHLFQEPSLTASLDYKGLQCAACYFLLVSVLGPFRAEAIGTLHHSDPI